MGRKTETKTKSRTDPAKWLMPHIKSVLGGAQNLYQQGQPTFAPFSQTTEQALGGIEQRAAQGSPVFAAGQQQLMDTIGGKYLTPDSNPYLRQYGDALAGQIQDRVNAEFSKAGRYGSGAHAGTTARATGDVLSGLYSNAYGQERGLQFGATQMAPGFANQEYADLNRLLGAGQARDIKAQQGVDDPYNQLLRYMSVISGVPQGQESSGKQTTTTTPGALDVLGTVGGLASSAAGMFGGVGGLLGGGGMSPGQLGGMLGLDIGNLPNQFSLPSFSQLQSTGGLSGLARSAYGF